MTYIRTVGDEEAKGAVAHNYDQCRRAAGGVYETSRMMSLWPELLEADWNRYVVIMGSDTALSRPEKETIAAALSAMNDCPYCIAHHRAMAIDAGAEPALIDALIENRETAPLDRRMRAILDFACNPQPQRIAPANIERLREAGLDDRAILEAAIVSGFFRDYNWRVSALGLELEDWFKAEEGR